MAENEPKRAFLCVLDARKRFFVLVGWTFIRMVNRRAREPIFAVFTPVFAPKSPPAKAPQEAKGIAKDTQRRSSPRLRS